MTRPPVTVDEVPRPVDVHARPRVAEVVVVDEHAGSVPRAFRDALNDLHRQATVTRKTKKR